MVFCQSGGTGSVVMLQLATDDTNSSNSQETFVEGRQVHSQMASMGIYSAHECSVSKSHNENIDIKCNARDLMRLY